MLTKIKSSKWAKYRLLFVLPVLIGLLVMFSCNQNESLIEKQKDTVTINDSKVYDNVDVMPEFPEGDLGLRKFIAINIIYPAKAKETGTEGKIFVQFIVNELGEVEQVKHIVTRVPVKERNNIDEVVCVGYTEVFNKDGKAYDELAAEAIRVVSTMPKWKPGVQDGRNVKVQFTIPINFQLK